MTSTPPDLLAVKALKAPLVGQLQLLHVQPDRPFILRTDASDRAIGAVLEQLPPESGAASLPYLNCKKLRTPYPSPFSPEN